ncbi:ABC transporter permease [Vulgatibacter sp.]|uniref:ABC transporter permease n=1 Tax=Vulgatibacter sp. TaxID=1971226 RepID=UPI0035647DA9
MRFPLFVALRFLREGRLQTGLILAGVSVGVAVIVFISALIDGLQSSLVERTLGSQAHVVVRPPEDLPRQLRDEGGAAVNARIEKSVQRTESIDAWQQLAAAIGQQPEVLAVSPVVAGAAFAQAGRASFAVALRGVEPADFNRVVALEDDIVAGRFDVDGRQVVIGIELARDLGLRVGDKLRLSTAEVGAEVLTVAGIFDLGNEDVNRRWALVSLRQAQSLLDLPGAITSLELKIDEIFAAREVAARIASSTGLEARSWMETNAQLLTALRAQTASTTMIRLFVVIAVALGIASVLVVSVVQRSRQIGILKAMGASTGEVMLIFLLQGGILGLLGSLVGCGLGAGLAFVFRQVARTPAGEPLFVIDVTFGLVAWAALVATLTGVASAVAPARRAAGLDPAAAIHGE